MAKLQPIWFFVILKILNLNLEKLVGQVYVGASVMAGKEKGVQAVLKSIILWRYTFIAL